MRDKAIRHYGLYLTTLIALLFVYREWVTITKPLGLFIDEAYYFGWSQALDWGYYSKPPMVAWLIRLTTDLFGNSEWAVKLASPFLYCLSGAILYQVGKRLSGERAGYFSAAIFLTMPLVSFNSLFITTDAPLIFCWAAALWLFILAQAKNAWRYWVLAGLVGGLGLLSKYTFILFPAAFLLYGALSTQGRLILTNPRFWSACALAITLLVPNLWWNYQHDFISFQHTAEISEQTTSHFSLARLLEFWGTQLVVAGPVTMLLLLVKLMKPSGTRASHQSLLLWSLFFPIFAVISLQALTAGANINWGAPAYVSTSLIVGIQLTKLRWKHWFKLLLGVNLLLMLSFYHYGSILNVIGVESKSGNDPFVRLEGFQELTRKAQPLFEEYPAAVIASDSRHLLAYFGYYLEPKQLNGRALDLNGHIEDQYELLYPIKDSRAKEHLFVTQKMTETDLRGHFEQVKELASIDVQVRSNLTRSVRVYLVSDFKGYN